MYIREFASYSGGITKFGDFDVLVFSAVTKLVIILGSVLPGLGNVVGILLSFKLLRAVVVVVVGRFVSDRVVVVVDDVVELLVVDLLVLETVVSLSLETVALSAETDFAIVKLKIR